MKIAVLTPSRGRPDKFTEMVNAIRGTQSGMLDVQVYLGVDNDDVTYPTRNGVHQWCGPRKRAGAWTNVLAREALDDGADVLAFFGDDHRPRTWDWDLRVAEAFEVMGSGLVYCADGLQDERLPTAPFWSADVIRALGWFYPPTLEHMYADNYWKHLAQSLGRCTYLPDVLIEHMHPSAGKSEMDDVYRENDTHYDADLRAYSCLVNVEHAGHLARAQAAL